MSGHWTFSYIIGISVSAFYLIYLSIRYGFYTLLMALWWPIYASIHESEIWLNSCLNGITLLSKLSNLHLFITKYQLTLNLKKKLTEILISLSKTSLDKSWVNLIFFGVNPFRIFYYCAKFFILNIKRLFDSVCIAFCRAYWSIKMHPILLLYHLFNIDFFNA